MSNFYCTFAAEFEKGEIAMYDFKPVKFNSEEERLAAKRRMVGMRKEFEARVKELMAQRTDLQIAQ